LDISDNVEIISKSVEISKSFANTNIGFHNVDLENTRNIGDLTRLAITLRNATSINEDQLNAISISMKIDPRLVKSEMLVYLEKEGMVEIKRNGRKITEIKVRILPVEDLIKIFGEKWHNDQPSPVDKGSIGALSLLSKSPYEENALVSELNLNDNHYDCMFSYGNSANYLGSFNSVDDKKVLWSPLYWLDKKEDVENYLKKQTDDSLIKIGYYNKSISTLQGFPKDLIIKPSDMSLIESGVHFGFFNNIQIASKQGAFQYLFTSSPIFDDPYKDVFERARLIVSCIRHGQYHADGTPIKYPSIVLQKMRENSMGAHPDAEAQYSLLRQNYIVDIYRDYTYGGKDFFKTRWIDSPENNKAAEIAERLLSGQETSIHSAEEAESYKILIKGTFNYTAEQRRIIASKNIADNLSYERMMESMRGGISR
jgi:hypothetical protein